MLELINPSIEQYIQNHTEYLHPELINLERETYLKVMLPNMISGKDQGMLLHLLVKLSGAKNILEIGTFTGFSAICMALGLSEGGKLTTLDTNPETEWIISKYIKKTNLSDKIDYILASGLDYIPSIPNQSLCMAFVDADKQNYPRYFELIASKLKSGGLLIFDNVLWKGKVTLPHPNADTEAIRKCNELIFKSPEFLNIIIPLRDGLMLAIKK